MSLKRSMIFALATAVTSGAALAASATTRPQPASRQFVYSVLRNGSPIGQYSMTVTTDGLNQTVDYKTDIQVRLLVLTAYEFHQTGKEVWTDGRFVSYKSSTDDNGKPHSVAMDSGTGGETLLVDGRRSHLPKGALPATFWSAKALKTNLVVKPDDGKVVQVKVVDEGPSSIELNGSAEQAQHFHVDGMGRDIWMVKGYPVRLQLKGSDNSTIVSQLMPVSSSP